MAVVMRELMNPAQFVFLVPYIDIHLHKVSLIVFLVVPVFLKLDMMEFFLYIYRRQSMV